MDLKGLSWHADGSPPAWRCMASHDCMNDWINWLPQCHFLTTPIIQPWRGSVRFSALSQTWGTPSWRRFFFRRWCQSCCEALVMSAGCIVLLWWHHKTTWMLAEMCGLQWWLCWEINMHHGGIKIDVCICLCFIQIYLPVLEKKKNLRHYFSSCPRIWTVKGWH